MNVVTYVVTGYLNEALVVKFTMGEVSETLTFAYDSSKPIKEFLDQQAVWVMPKLKQKNEEPAPINMMQFVGTTGAVNVPDMPPAPPPMQPQFFHEHPDPAQATPPATPRV